jgi:hypothetical protein
MLLYVPFWKAAVINVPRAFGYVVDALACCALLLQSFEQHSHFLSSAIF